MHFGLRSPLAYSLHLLLQLSTRDGHPIPIDHAGRVDIDLDLFHFLLVRWRPHRHLQAHRMQLDGDGDDQHHQ